MKKLCTRRCFACRFRMDSIPVGPKQSPRVLFEFYHLNDGIRAQIKSNHPPPLLSTSDDCFLKEVVVFNERCPGTISLFYFFRHKIGRLSAGNDQASETSDHAKIHIAFYVPSFTANSAPDHLLWFDATDAAEFSDQHVCDEDVCPA